MKFLWKCKELENIIVSDVIQAPNDKYQTLSLSYVDPRL